MQNRRLSNHKSHKENVAPIKRIGYAIMFFLVGILFPILIWVALFAAIRKPLLRVLMQTAYAVLFLLVGVLMPVLIWVGLVIAVVHKPVSYSRPWSEPVSTLGDILVAAGINIQGEAIGGKALRDALLVRQSIPDIRKLIARAGL